MGVIVSVGASFLLASSYVLSLYLWPPKSSSGVPLDRDHPATIKRRFLSALAMLFVSPLFVLAFGDGQLLQ